MDSSDTTGESYTASTLTSLLVGTISQVWRHIYRFIWRNVIQRNAQLARMTRRFQSGWCESLCWLLRIRSDSIKVSMEEIKFPTSQSLSGTLWALRSVVKNSATSRTPTSYFKIQTSFSWVCWVKRKRWSLAYIMRENVRMNTMIECTGFPATRWTWINMRLRGRYTAVLIG